VNVLVAALRRHPHAEIGIAVVVWAVTLLTTAAGPTGGQVDAAAVCIAAIAAAVLVARRRFPLLVLLASAIAAEAYLIHYGGHRGEMVLAAPLIALYTVADESSRRRALTIGVLVVLAFAGLHMLAKPSSPLGADNVALAALGALAVAAGDSSRNRRAYQAEVERRARHAEADREAEAARRVTDERLRIARDLHDVVGHHLALIHVQAGVAAHLLDGPPRPVVEALDHIRTASKTALGDLRDTIGLLRQPGDLAAPVEPVNGLAGLDELLGSFRRSGLSIVERVDGIVRPIAVVADLTAYRVIQESLTNVCKHAGPTAVEVRMTFRPELVRIVIDNASGPLAPVPGTGGHGLAGMRERVTALGGRLAAGPRHGGGFRVTATLPTAGRAA
jgi:signal transduction histidine kinase